MSDNFNAPSAQDAARFLSTVPYRDRLLVGAMRWPSGYVREPVRSLHELHCGLTITTKKMPALHVPTAARWVEEHLGDAELAAAMNDCGCGGELCYAEVCGRLREMIGARLEQLRSIAGDEIAARARPSSPPLEA